MLDGDTDYLRPALAEYLLRLHADRAPVRVDLIYYEHDVAGPGDEGRRHARAEGPRLLFLPRTVAAAMISLADLATAWTAFFHTPEPPLTIALFRILFGLVTIASALLYLPHASLWLGPAGALSHARWEATYGGVLFSLFRWLPPGRGSIHAIFALHLLGATCLALGLGTRASAAIVFVTLTSIHHRHPEVTHGGDSLMRMMSFLLIFSPAGDAWSLDAILAGVERPERSRRRGCCGCCSCRSRSWYFQSFVAKLEGETWRQGTAVYWVSMVSDYRRRPVPAAMRTLWWSRLATWGTLALEFALGPLVWISECRYPLVAAAAIFHLGLEVLMNLQLFGAIMLTGLYDIRQPIRPRAARRRPSAVIRPPTSSARDFGPDGDFGPPTRSTWLRTR